MYLNYWLNLYIVTLSATCMQVTLSRLLADSCANHFSNKKHSLLLHVS